MAEPAREAVDMKDFPGTINNADRMDIPPGSAAEQINLCSFKIGEMVTRLGYKDVTFEE